MRRVRGSASPTPAIFPAQSRRCRTPPIAASTKPPCGRSSRRHRLASMFEDFLKDLKQSLRMFRQSPAFTLAAVAALTLGIGANSAIFSVVNAVMLRPVAFPDPDRLVVFLNTSPQGSGPGASPAKFQHWRSLDSVVQEVSVF